jgi:hypothetical protein
VGCDHTPTWWVRKDLNLHCLRRLVYSQVQYHSATHPLSRPRVAPQNNTTHFAPRAAIASSKYSCKAICNLPSAIRKNLAFKLSKYTPQPILNWSRYISARLEDTISLHMPMGSSSGIAPEFLGSQPSVLDYWTTTNMKKVGLVYTSKPTEKSWCLELGFDLWEIQIGAGKIGAFHMTARQILPI